MQETKDQVQWSDSMSALRQPEPRMLVCAELLQQLQGVRVSLSWWHAIRNIADYHTASSSRCPPISRPSSSKSMTSTTISPRSGRRSMSQATAMALSARPSTETINSRQCCLHHLHDREPSRSASTLASTAQRRASSTSEWRDRASRQWA